MSAAAPPFSREEHMMPEQMISILDPRAERWRERSDESAKAAVAVVDTGEFCYGFVDNGKPMADFILKEIGEHLRSELGITAVLPTAKAGGHSVPAEAEILEYLKERADVVVTGLGD